ncbi:Putative membrane protein [Zobellia galactanivorans]|uniref:Putative membrane protein n=1 Tax=Zobellia galactanivorans (strain DSM 12802 / CCUG 47099 / CIP 106680 / NCIMB 13871 / Dsij) TaxID=63186 RepID=G0L2R1_ZOBGA|nr:Putative membrane protein [Zobellia galactanivorans]
MENPLNIQVLALDLFQYTAIFCFKKRFYQNGQTNNRLSPKPIYDLGYL